MQDDNYRESLVESVNKLVEIREMVYGAIIPLAMSGEMKEWNDLIDEGEYFTFRKEMFEAFKDTNVLLLTSLLDNVEKTYESLVNLNGLKREDD